MTPRGTLLLPPALVATVLLPFLACDGGSGPTIAEAYRCPMHPTYTSDRPGDCPICGMKLVRASAGAPASSPTPADGSRGPALVAVAPPPGSLALAGVLTAPVVRGPFHRTLRTVGEVKPDETLIHHIHTKVPGWIEHLYANFTGQMVRRGEPVLSIYSPELLATQEEYLAARDASARFGASTIPEVRRGGEDLLRAARRRLELFDVPPGFVEELEQHGVMRTVTLLAPSSGFVSAKGVYHGMQVEPGMELYTLTDLAQVWIEGAIFESEAHAVSLGLPARVTLAYDPGTVIEGRIDYVYPFLDTESRTLRVRLVVPNAGIALKPGMYANLELLLDAGADSLVIPDDALIDTGERRVVFVESAPGHFTPRDVDVGHRGGGKAQVLSGLEAGERVATRANFLLDSESRLRAALGSAAPAHDHGGAR